ncbi:hypothetical protein [Virgibacillus dokdonensis]|uniref:Uncharacterized protein n=1 Tax=Virgibacillus dokdonensis TaxID=302167 RepID=A0ABU7VK68_9BACI
MKRTIGLYEGVALYVVAVLGSVPFRFYDPVRSIVEDTKEIIENDYWKTYYLQDIALEVGS